MSWGHASIAAQSRKSPYRGRQRRDHRAFGESEPVAPQRTGEQAVFEGVRGDNDRADVDRLLVRHRRVADRTAGKQPHRMVAPAAVPLHEVRSGLAAVRVSVRIIPRSPRTAKLGRAERPDGSSGWSSSAGVARPDGPNLMASMPASRPKSVKRAPRPRLVQPVPVASVAADPNADRLPATWASRDVRCLRNGSDGPGHGALSG